jgi:hypothetical protein
LPSFPKDEEEGDSDNSVVVFLKDDVSEKNVHQKGYRNNFASLINLASRLVATKTDSSFA